MPRGIKPFKDDAARLDAYIKIATEYPAKNVMQISQELGLRGETVYSAIQYMRKAGIKIPRVGARSEIFKPKMLEFFKVNKPELL